MCYAPKDTKAWQYSLLAKLGGKALSCHQGEHKITKGDMVIPSSVHKHSCSQYKSAEIENKTNNNNNISK